MLTALRNIKMLPVENKFSIFNRPSVAQDLGKPTIKLEFETNEELVNFQERINNIQSNLEPLNFDKKRGFYDAEDLSGITNFEQKSLGAYGDFYEIYDLRSRAKKELDELKANKNIYFKKVKDKSIHNIDKNLLNLTIDLPTWEIRKKIKDTNYLYVHLKENEDGFWEYGCNLFFPNVLKRDLQVPTFVGVFSTIYITIDLTKVFNWTYYDDYKNNIVGYITKDYKDEIYKKAISQRLNGFKEQIKNRTGKWQKETEKEYKYFKMYYENPAAYNISDEKGREFSTLDAPNDLYIISDTRLKSKKDLDEIKALQKYNIQPFKPEEYTNDTGVKLVLLKNIKKDTARFQNRENAESSESVNRIINAVKKGDFNWVAFDPVVLWKDPQDGNIYVLSGHSRTRAFEILSEQGATVNGKDFNRIPAKFFEGSEQDAIDFALNSNTLSTKETDVERAKYYRRLIGTMPEYKLKELAEQNEGKNANRILAYAHLRPGSYTLNALTRLQDSSTENAELVKTVADWIGRLFIQFPQLTLEHDKEIFNWLMLEGHYGVGAGKINNYQKLLDVIRLAVFRLQGKDGFESSKRLNLSNIGGESDSMKNYNEKLKKLNNEIKNANAELKAKRKEFLQRQKADNTITRAEIERALKPYNDNILRLQKEIIDLNANKSKYLDADKKQLSIFGSPDPDVYNNCELWCGGMNPTYKQLESYNFMFDAPDNKNKLLGYGLKDTLQIISATVKKYYKDCAKIAAHLKADSEKQSAFNLWHWLHKNIRYNYDAQGKEQIRSPRRVWADRKSGVDCDCLSVFVYCTLLCMDYKPKFEIVAFKNKQQYSHIFVNLNGIVIDRVWFIFNSRPPNITKTKFFTVNINTLQGLCGMF